MPKAYLLRRPAGLYARFLVPVDVRPILGLRFIVRRLPVGRPDDNRLAAAKLAVALSQLFDRARQGAMGDREKALRELAATVDQWTGNIELANGHRFTNLRVEGREDADALMRAVQALTGDVSQIGPRPQRRIRATGPMLSDAITSHLADLARARRASKTITESRHSLRILLGVVGDMPASELSIDHARAFLDAVLRWPKHATKNAAYRDLSVREILALPSDDAATTPKNNTLRKHRARLSVFIRHLIERRLLTHNFLDAIPDVSDHAVDADADTGRPFTPAEMEVVFGPAFEPWARKYPHRWFGPMLALYSGARVGELSQLRPSDIRVVDGTLGFILSHKPERNSIKNPNSKRFVPVAEALVTAGFMIYVEEALAAGVDRLFPNLPNSTGLGFGRQLSRQFSHYIKSRGIEEPGMGMHAFRHYFITHLDRALAAEGVKREDRDQRIGRLTGHHGVPASVLRSVYVDANGLPLPSFIEPETLPERVATLARFTPPVSLPAYEPGQFATQLKQVARRRSGKP